MRKCVVCGGVLANHSIDYCTSHTEVMQIIRAAFQQWLAAYGDIGPDAFLSRILKLPETGDRAREMAQFLVANPRSWTG
jgi:hypothetical protein